MSTKTTGHFPHRKASALADWLARLLRRRQPPADLVLVVTALCVGLLTGIGAVIFRYLIRAVGWLSYEWVPTIAADWGRAHVLVVPAIGGLLVGLLVHFVAQEVKGSGVPEVIASVALAGGRIRPVVAVVKPLASALTIGSGGSAGREGPIVQIGSAIGSSVGQFLRLSDDRVSNLVACGAASGIAATFNAPIAGVIFALEVIMGGRFTVRYFSSVVVSAVVASVIGRAVFGNYPAFAVPIEYGINSLWEFLFYPLLGLLAALTGVVFVRLLYGTTDLFDRWQSLAGWIKPGVGGLLLGALALLYPLAIRPLLWAETPPVFGVGYDIIESALANQLTYGMAVALLVLKLVATSLTLGSGGSGGVFAPSLFIGAMLGVAFASGVDAVVPGIAAPAGAYALVGMAAVSSATAHAPITSVLILFELTGDYRIILPLMLTVVVATVVAQRLLDGESIYTLKLTRRGVRLRRGRDIDILESVTVRETMARDFVTVEENTTLQEVTRIFTESHRHGMIVLDAAGTLWGIVTITDVETALQNGKALDTPVRAIGTTWPRLKVAFPDDTIGDALAVMGVRGLGRLPVVAREDPYQLLGLVRREDMIKAYNLALARRAEIHHRTQQMLASHEEGTEFVDIFLQSGDKAVGKSIQQIAASMPTDCVLISIKRDDTTLIPHGDTVLQPGDHITAFVRSHDADDLFHSLHT